MYDEEIPINTNKDFSDAKGDAPSTIHHFYHKLFHLVNNMNTKTAKELAIERTEFMKKFVDVFLDEWHGKK